MENRPSTLTIKQFLIRKLSVDIPVPEKTIETVVNHQFSSLLEAFSSKKRIEVVGLGRFMFKEFKLPGMIGKYEKMVSLYERALLDETISSQKRKATEMKLEDAKAYLRDLKPFITEIK